MRTILETPYWIWQEELSASLCEAIIDEGLQFTEKKATINSKDSNNIIKSSSRIGTVNWFPKEHWISSIINRYVEEANQLSGWNFKISGFEKVQLGNYSTGSYYKWHRDISSNTPYHRKISVTIQLSKPESYKGGDFKIRDFWNTKTLKIKEDIKQQGTIIVFPSLMMHQVSPIIEGTRYSLVQWYNGPDFV